jgi:hypothetical protein
MITHIVSLKIAKWVRDYKSTDAAAIADFLLKVTATNLQSAIHPEEISAHHRRSKYNIGEESTTGGVNSCSSSNMLHI